MSRLKVDQASEKSRLVCEIDNLHQQLKGLTFNNLT